MPRDFSLRFGARIRYSGDIWSYVGVECQVLYCKVSFVGFVVDRLHRVLRLERVLTNMTIEITRSHESKS